MDRLIRRFDAVKDGDLRFVAARGVAYQRDMGAGRVAYDASYLAKVDAYDGTEIAAAVNAGRCALIARHLAAGARVLDYGAGSGAFVRAAQAAGFNARGFEVMPEARERLLAAGQFDDETSEYPAVTLWDCIEHLEDPEVAVLKRIAPGAHVFVSLPVFDDLEHVRESKHYRPGEHLYYWTPQGFIDWMALYGFRLLETSEHEVAAGRESIGAFAFIRDLPDYHDHVGAYRDIHASRFYGASATELYLGAVADIVRRRRPASILDYGCGRSDLVAHFWLDGKRRIARYDPAIREYRRMPDGLFDLVLCCDVMEHIPMASVDRVLAEVREKGSVAFFSISLKLARAKLPDGRNAHVTLLSRTEWLRWIADYFGGATEMKSQWDHELLLLAGKGA